VAHIDMNEQLEALRSALAENIRQRVAGPDAAAKAAAMRDATGPRWFTDDSPIVRVHSDASMFIGGLRALLLQSLHPLAMAGVAIHSDYRNDPWGRLQRTADFLAATSFGSAEVAEQAVARVRSVHERVKGTAPDGREYSANDPHLLRWVHVAEVDSFLAAHQRYGAHPLNQDERNRYVAETAVIARALGVPAPPMSEQALRDQIRQFRPELASTKEARDAAKYLVLQPPLSLPARAGYSLIAAAAVALLPRWARLPLRLPYLPIAESLVAQPLGGVVTRTFRWAMEGEPEAGFAARTNAL
jgi:uncharacterized protein (DUF2236 family)